LKRKRVVVAVETAFLWCLCSQLVFLCSESLDTLVQKKDNLYKSWSRKFYNFGCSGGKSANSTAVPGISIAMDSRLENGIEMCAELRLRVCIF